MKRIMIGLSIFAGVSCGEVLEAFSWKLWGWGQLKEGLFNAACSRVGNAVYQRLAPVPVPSVLYVHIPADARVLRIGNVCINRTMAYCDITVPVSYRNKVLQIPIEAVQKIKLFWQLRHHQWCQDPQQLKNICNRIDAHSKTRQASKIIRAVTAITPSLPVDRMQHADDVDKVLTSWGIAPLVESATDEPVTRDTQAGILDISDLIIPRNTSKRLQAQDTRAQRYSTISAAAPLVAKGIYELITLPTSGPLQYLYQGAGLAGGCALSTTGDSPLSSLGTVGMSLLPVVAGMGGTHAAVAYGLGSVVLPFLSAFVTMKQ